MQEGSFQCFCKEGFKPDPEDSFKCVDVDECSELTNNCQQVIFLYLICFSTLCDIWLNFLYVGWFLDLPLSIFSFSVCVWMSLALFFCLFNLLFSSLKAVVYFNQRTGALHAVPWSKSIVFAFKQVFSQNYLVLFFRNSVYLWLVPYESSTT